MKNLLLFALGCALLFSSCKKEDDPFLNNQAPICPTGFTGPTCDVELEPRSMTIEGVRITDFKMTDSGSWPWDLAGKPDIYIEIQDKDFNILYASETKNNVTNSQNHYFNCSLKVKPNESYFVFLYDEDTGSSDDFIDNKFFTPYKEGLSFPLYRIYSKQGFRMEVDFTYEF